MGNFFMYRLKYRFVKSETRHYFAKIKLPQNAGAVAEIAYQVGFGSQAHFTTVSEAVWVHAERVSEGAEGVARRPQERKRKNQLS